MIKKAILLSLLMFSCAETVDNLDTNTKKSYSALKTAGGSCASGCIWSSFAVSNGIQSKQEECNTGPCACVVSGNAYQLCEYSSDTSISTPQDNSWSTASNQSSVPYYNQYNNKNYPGATCQNTSVAMVLSYFEFNIHPDTIFNRWGKDYAQSPDGLNRVYSHYAANSTIKTITNASQQTLISALNEGSIVIVHGYFTGSGHVIVITGYDGTHYYVNDPAGAWKQCFKCGYGSSYNGITKYSKQSLENAVFTSDGYSYLPGWIHIIKRK